MIDINLIRENPQKVVDALKKRNFDFDAQEFLRIDAQYRHALQNIEMLKAERNKASSMVPQLKKAGESVDALIQSTRELGDKIAALEEDLDALYTQWQNIQLSLPNMPDDDIVAGGKEANVPIFTFGQKPQFDFEPKSHIQLCESLGLIDYDRATKLSGNGFWIYRGLGAQLEWALLNFFVSEHLADGYEFVLPPELLNEKCGFGSGQFPKFGEEDVYYVDKASSDSMRQFLLPTAETAMVNLYSNEVIPYDALPLRLFAYSPCFRKEAGSYRAEERGMIRGHQFNKVEMIGYARPDQSDAMFEELVNKAQRLVQKLGLHYQLSKLAAGDVAGTMARTYDIEVWIPSMGIYKEVSSVSNARSFQALRSNTKYKTPEGKNAYVHTLNGSGLATARVIPAIVEQYQNADGSVTIPEVLRPFMGGRERLEPIKK